MENPFALPPPLFSRKRKAAVSCTDGQNDRELAPLVSEATYEAYSIDGQVRESAVYQDELERRTAVRDALSHQLAKRVAPTANAQGTAVTGALALTSIQPVATSMHTHMGTPTVASGPPRHLAAVVLERAERERSSEIAQAINIARRLSSIPIADHIEFMRLRHKRTTALATGMPVVLALTPEEQEAWGRLEASVKLEQLAFMGDLERMAKKEKLAEYTFVPACVDQLYDAFLQTCRNQVMHLYPRYYDPQMAVRLHGSSASTAERTASTMKHIQEAAHEGPRIILDEALLNESINIQPQTSGDVEGTDVTHVPLAWSAISADPMAEKLMEQYDCDVAMTSSTLSAIFDTSADEISSKSSGWMIPVKSRVCMVKGKPRRQIYLDRPLVNAEVSAREKISAMTHPLTIDALTRFAEPREKRVSYHVWRLGEFKILIRTKTHLFLGDPAATAPRPVSLFVKPDHRPLGLEEKITDGELRRMWLHSWIRGGSTIVLGRLSPKSCNFTSWSKYPLSKLLHSLGSPGFPDSFEPIDHFVAVNTVLTTLLSLPPSSFLLKFDSSSEAKGQGRELHILRSATEIGLEEDHNHQFDLFQHINKCGHTSSDVWGYVAPSWPPVSDRIPYTYRTGSCCTEMLQRSICEKEGNGDPCDSVHLRLVFTKSGIKWVFEDVSTTQAARRANVRHPVKGAKKLYPQLTPKFPFCRGKKGIQASKLLMNVHLPIRCEDPNCPLPHLSLHAIADRVADDELRAARERRRKHKTKNRARGREQDRDDWY